MKKTLLVVALAAILVFVFTGSAFAEFNRSGQQRLGAPSFPTTEYGGLTGGWQSGGESAWVENLAPGQTNPVGGAGTFTYMDWSTGLGTNSDVIASGNSPHGNYTTTTVKCVVCHAVHYAAPGNAPVNSSISAGQQDADTLLRMKASQSCGYCHATAGMAVNGRPVYDGLNPTPAETGGDTNTGHYTGTNCSTCHTSVHGMDQDTTVASLSGFLLKKQPLDAVGPSGFTAATDEMIENITIIENLATFQGFDDGTALGFTPFEFNTDVSGDTRAAAVGIFCAECHNGAYSTGTAGAGASTNVKGSDAVAYTGHRLTAASSTAWNVGHTVSSSDVTATVAWAPSPTCSSCHDSEDIYGNQAFPHSWGNTKMWLTSKSNVGGASENLPFGTGLVPDGDFSSSAYNQGRPQLYDGVCLKCHVSSTGAGVGYTY